MYLFMKHMKEIWHETGCYCSFFIDVYQSIVAQTQSHKHMHLYVNSVPPPPIKMTMHSEGLHTESSQISPPVNQSGNNDPLNMTYDSSVLTPD